MPSGSAAGYGGFTGDFYTVWKNAFDFGAAACGAVTAVPAQFPVPTLSDGGLALTMLLVVAVAFLAAAPARRQR